MSLIHSSIITAINSVSGGPICWHKYHSQLCRRTQAGSKMWTSRKSWFRELACFLKAFSLMYRNHFCILKGGIFREDTQWLHTQYILLYLSAVGLWYWEYCHQHLSLLSSEEDYPCTQEVLRWEWLGFTMLWDYRQLKNTWWYFLIVPKSGCRRQVAHQKLTGKTQ